MPNRQLDDLPALYVEAEPFHTRADACPRTPAVLEVYDVTYLHYHSVLELGLCVAGEGVCHVEGRAYPFRAGDVQVIFPFQRHLSQNTEGPPSLWHWVSIDPMALLRAGGLVELRQVDDWLCTQMALCGILSPAEHPTIAGLIRRLAHEASHEGLHRVELCSALLYALAVELCRASEGLPKLPLRRDPQLLRLAPALEAVTRALDAGEQVTVQALADACGMGVSGFRHAFGAAIGLPPKEYMLGCAMRKAQRLLLRTDMSVTEVGLAVGFEDVSGFNRRFMAKNGVSPSEFRRRHAG